MAEGFITMEEKHGHRYNSIPNIARNLLHTFARAVKLLLYCLNVTLSSVYYTKENS
jgi:hypothetical protein